MLSMIKYIIMEVEVFCGDERENGGGGKRG